MHIPFLAMTKRRNGEKFVSEILGWSVPRFGFEESRQIMPCDDHEQLMAFYDAEIRPHTVELTRRASMVEDTQRNRLLISAAIAVGMLIFLPFLLLLIAAPIMFWWYRMPNVEFRREIKERFMLRFLAYYGQDFTFAADGGISLSHLQASGILPKYDRYHQEDFVTGSYKGVALTLCELELDEAFVRRTKDRDEVDYKNVFKGLVVKLDMQKNFTGHTVVKRDVGKLGNLAQGMFDALERVTLEDPIFEKAFEVYSDSQQEARYLLTPAFMERLLHLEELVVEKRKNAIEQQAWWKRLFDAEGSKLSRLFTASANKGIQASFFQNQLVLLIPSRHNYFEMGKLDAPISFFGEINAIHAEMRDLFTIIDTLQLDRHTGL